MIVYIDIFLLENFIVNLFLLLVTVKLLKLKYKKTIYLASIIGTLYTLVLFIDIKVLSSVFFKVLIAFFMIYITIPKTSYINKLKSVGVFFAVSFLLCGICFGFSVMGKENILTEGFVIDNYSIKYLIISVMILYIVTVRGWDFVKERRELTNFIYDIEISFKDSTCQIRGLLDTGNALREPITNLPCIIVESEYLEKIPIEEDKLFHISYKTIGNNGMLKGFKGDTIRIRKENEEWRTVDAIVCFCKNKLSKENDFNALLSRGVI